MLNEYNIFNELSQVRDTDSISPTVYWQAKEWDHFGRVTTVSTINDKVTTTNTFDTQRGNLTSIQTTSNLAGVVQDMGYAFDAGNNLIARTNQLAGTSETFLYDNANRLVEVKDNGMPTHLYEYDVRGNFTTKGNLDYTIEPDSNRVLSVRDTNTSIDYALAYDSKGNITTGLGGATIQYASFNKPLEISEGGRTTLYQYGMANEVIRSISSSGTERAETDYIQGVLRERRVYTDDNVQPDRVDQEYLVRVGGIVVAVVSDSTDSEGVTTTESSWLFRDHLGSITVILDETGAVTEQFYYDPFGVRTGTPSGFDSIAHERGFSGHRHLPGSNLIHMGGRLYDAALGRFLSSDPFVQAPDNLQSHNRYSYALNSPLSYVDPSGYSWLDALGGVIWTQFKKIGVPIYKKVKAEANRFTSKFELGQYQRLAGDIHSGGHFYATGDLYGAQRIRSDYYRKSQQFAKYDAIAGSLGGLVVDVVVLAAVTTATGGTGTAPVTAGQSAAIAATTTFAMSYANSESVEDAAEAGLKAGLLKYATAGLSEFLTNEGIVASQAMANAISAGAAAELRGNDFEKAFAISVISQAASGMYKDSSSYENSLRNVGVAALAGGLLSSVNGGDFSDGAKTQGFARLKGEAKSHGNAWWDAQQQDADSFFNISPFTDQLKAVEMEIKSELEGYKQDLENRLKQRMPAEWFGAEEAGGGGGRNPAMQAP